MTINEEVRTKLLDIFKNTRCRYRRIIAKRTGVHPNTVTNVLKHGHDNTKVAMALVVLSKEIAAKRQVEEKQEEELRQMIKTL